MSNDLNGKSGPQFSSGPLITSAAMVGAGTLLALAGVALGGGYLLRVARQWVREMEVPPNELARIKWNQARAAVSAGAAVWQDGPHANNLTGSPASVG
jgi:hypothetical protein